MIMLILGFVALAVIVRVLAQPATPAPPTWLDDTCGTCDTDDD
jgi:hypothetical protein